MSVNRYATYGDYADGYSADYVPDGSALFSGAGSSFAPSRMHGYPTYVMVWEQVTSKSAGGETFAGTPYVQELLITLPWIGLSGADRTALITHFNAMNGAGTAFSLSSPLVGPALPVRFASDTLPAIQETAWDRYRTDVTLRVTINYPQMETTGAPAAITGNRFVVGGVAVSFPVQLRSGNGYNIDKQQTIERLSDGSPVIYNKSRLTLQPHRYAMILDFDGFINLQSFFFTWVHGAQNKFTWVDAAGTSRTVRLASNQITVRQTAYNRYETELTLLEEL